MQRALRERRERAHLLDLVAEELDAERLAAGRREDVDEPAADRELPAVLRPLDALVAGERKRLGQRTRFRAPRPARCASAPAARAPAASPSRRGRGRNDDEPAALEHVERARPLADEVRRRREARVPADAAARQKRDALRAEVPAGGLGEVARVGVLGNEDRQRAAELLVQRRHDERQRRLRDACAGRQRLGELLQALALQQLADEREQHGALFDVSDHDA